MAIIRAAKPADFAAFMELGMRCKARTVYAEVPEDRQKILHAYGQCISSALGFAALAEHEGRLVGVLLGMVDTLWWSSRRYATDLLFYAERPGAGLRLARSFIAWARAVPGVVEVTMAQASGIDVVRSEAIYRRLGLSRVGGLYTRVL